MTDMQTSLSLLIVWSSNLNPIINFSTHLWPMKWKSPRLYLCLAHSIPSPPMLMQHMQQPITNDMIHFISSYDRIGSSILTSLTLNHCLGPSTSSLAQASASHVVPRFKASDLPFTLATGPSSQASSWSSPPWLHDSMTYLICNELLYHHIITYGLISYVSHINIISPPKLSLNYQNQTRTFHPPTLSASAPPEPDVAAITGGGEIERSHIGVRAWVLQARIRHSMMLHVDLVALKIGCWRGIKKHCLSFL